MKQELSRIEPVTQPALTTRSAALTVSDFYKLDNIVMQHYDIKTETVMKSSEYGAIFLEIDKSVALKEGVHPPQNFLDAICRPATGAYVVVHLTRLAAHKRQSKGASALKIILEDLSYDLAGMSEWAIMKTCEEFRRKEGSFFPETPEIISTVRKWNDVAQKMIKPPTPRPPKGAEFAPDPPKYRKRYIRFIKLMSKQNKTSWQVRWCAAFQKIAEEKQARERKSK